MFALCVAGARPNFMKVAPVMSAFDDRGMECELVHTGQHYDASMSDVFFDDLGLRRPDHSLGVGSGSHAVQTGKVMAAFEPLIEQTRPDVVVVVGDVNSTVACALVAAKYGCLVAHVESGLRSRDWSMPEEINRVVTDRLSDALLAPSADAVDNLVAEGYRPDQIHLVGNVMVDTLLTNLDRARQRPILSDLGLERKGYALVTMHRPANVDDPVVLSRLMAAVESVADRLPVVLPAHPRSAESIRSLTSSENVSLIDPAGYLDFVALQDGAAVVLTDSGGVQEETTVLGVPCVTMRESTERPITVSEGTNVVVGSDPERIIAAASAALDGAVPVRHPALWDGKAGERIADALAVMVDGDHPRPTDLVVAD